MSDLINSVVKALDILNSTSNNFTAAMATEPVIEKQEDVKQAEEENKDAE